jgi:hypothetical protein
MNIIWLKIKEIFSNLIKNYKVYIIAVIVILLLILFFKIKIACLENKNAKLQEENQVKNALLDTIHTYKNKLGEIVNEKLTLQFQLKNQKYYNNQLNDSQKELFKRIKNLDNKNNIITAALVKSKFIIDSLMLSVNGVIDSTDNSINFDNNTNLTDINIDVTIFNVKPFDKFKPTKLLINNLSFENKQFITFNWDNKKPNYPVSFSISNSNKYIKTYDIQSYAIPELKKTDIKPNFWQKMGNFIGDGKSSVIKIGVGVGIGYLVFRK